MPKLSILGGRTSCKICIGDFNVVLGAHEARGGNILFGFLVRSLNMLLMNISYFISLLRGLGLHGSKQLDICVCA